MTTHSKVPHFISKLTKNPVYLFLLVLAPIINLYALNRLELGNFDLIRPIAVSLLVVAILLAVLRFTSASIQRAGLIGLFLLASILLYGFVQVTASQVIGTRIGHRTLLPIWLLISFGGLAFIGRQLRNSRHDFIATTSRLNFLSTLLFLMSIFSLITSKTIENKDELDIDDTLEWKAGIPKLEEKPDVYFVILDAYARQDVLETRFNYDNSSFTSWLEDKGFSIGQQSHANYPWTHLSLSSTLNGSYLQELVPTSVIDAAPEERRKRYQYYTKVLGDNFVKNSRTHRFFTRLGYDIRLNNSGYAVSQRNAASIGDAMNGKITNFEKTLIGKTLLLPFLTLANSGKGFQISKSSGILRTLERLASESEESGPKFVFYHVLSPHQPYSFNKDGSIKNPDPIFEKSDWLEDRRAVPGYGDFVLKNYPINVEGLNVHMKETIDTILENSNGEAIIIIQSDHGPSSKFDLNSAENTDIIERFGILNTVYLPPRFGPVELDSTQSSVNTFPWMINKVFGSDIPLQEDRAYYSRGDLDFVEVTEDLK